MIENLLFTALGWLLGYFTPSSFWEHRWVKDIGARKQHRSLEKLLNAMRNRIVVGRFTIDNFSAVQVFDKPLSIHEVASTFTEVKRELPPDVLRLQEIYVPHRVAELKNSGLTVDFNDTYSLRAIRIERPQEAGIRRNRPVFCFEPSNFKYYIGVNEILDEPLLDFKEGANTIRARYLGEYSSFEWSELGSIPIHMWFATVTAVIAGGQLVVAIRSGMQSITDGVDGSHERWRGAMSCAEGMLRPVDSRTRYPHEEPSPFSTALRGLEDELGLKSGSHFTESDVQFLGLGFDTKRFQPVGVFLLEIRNMGFMDVYESWQSAKDRQENKTLIGVPVTSQDLAELMLGQVQYEGRPVHLFSNHQQLGAFLTASHVLGAPAMTTALR